MLRKWQAHTSCSLVSSLRFHRDCQRSAKFSCFLFISTFKYYSKNFANANCKLFSDLNHESSTLALRNVSRNDTDAKYECVAANGVVPSISKKFTLNVYCKLRFTSLILFYLIRKGVRRNCQIFIVSVCQIMQFALKMKTLMVE